MRVLPTWLCAVALLGCSPPCPAQEIRVAPGIPHGAYNFTTLYYDQKVDHFSYGVQPLTFKQKYLVNDAHWNASAGPILFYTGNEGAIELFAQNTGFMFELAPQLQAMVVFAEHRYYGSSMPFGNKSYTHKQYYQYQSSMQALEDYVELIQFLRTNITGAAKSPVIAFGGSYGGMLAAWIRIKYPHIVQGAIAASAPVAQFTGLTPCEDFNRLTSAVYRNASQACEALIKGSWKAIDAETKSANDKAWLTSQWKLCQPLKTSDDVQKLKEYLTDLWTNLAMANYPYPANFLAPLPAYPVAQVCKAMTAGAAGGTKQVLQSVFAGLSIYFNNTGTAKCQQFTSDGMPQSLDGRGWDLQSCTEMVMPICADGEHDMFEAQRWDLSEFSRGCLARWRTRPEPYKMQHVYGGRELGAATNIVFSNGNLDPWSTGGVKKTINSKVLALVIEGGAHHLDLRAAEHADPQSVRDARANEVVQMKRWIDDYNNGVVEG